MECYFDLMYLYVGSGCRDRNYLFNYYYVYVVLCIILCVFIFVYFLLFAATQCLPPHSYAMDHEINGKRIHMFVCLIFFNPLLFPFLFIT